MVRSASCSVAPPLLGLDEYVPTAEGERSRPRSELLDDGVAAVADGDGVAVGHLRAVQTSLPENRPQGAYGSCSCGTGAFRLNPSLASLVFVRSRIPQPVVFRACDAEPLDDADPAVRLSGVAATLVVARTWLCRSTQRWDQDGPGAFRAPGNEPLRITGLYPTGV